MPKGTIIMATYHSLGILRGLIGQVDNPALAERLEGWIGECVVEFGMDISISSRELEYTRDKPEEYMRYKVKAAAHDLGEKLIALAGSKETYPNAYGERTTYRAFAIKPTVER